MSIIICILTLLISCGREQKDAHFSETPRTRVAEKLSLYCEKSRTEFLARKWAVYECDGLLFTSLRGIACGDIDIDAFESTVEPGQWYRNPNKDCFIASKVGVQGSDSSISKDMYIGLIMYLTHKKDVLALRRTIEYGKQHDWIVGEAKDDVTLISKCLITPPTQTLLRDAYNYSGGSLTDVYSIENSWVVNSGFKAHLDVLAILLRGKINGKITGIDLAILKEQAKRQPSNALFQAAKARYDDGDMSKVEELLLDANHWPEDHLPNNRDNHCSNYLYQRDESPNDWEPCPQEQLKEHDGTDFVFAAAIATGVF